MDVVRPILHHECTQANIPEEQHSASITQLRPCTHKREPAFCVSLTQSSVVKASLSQRTIEFKNPKSKIWERSEPSNLGL